VFQVRLFSALIKDIEQAPPAHAWGGRSSLGALIAEFPAPGSSLGGWVHSVSFSADGNRVAWVAHDSSITVADPKRPVMRFKTQFLPFRAITWVAPDKVVAAGHDCSPYLYKVTPEGQLTLVCKLDVYKKREAGGLTYVKEISASSYSLMTKIGPKNAQNLLKNNFSLLTIGCVNYVTLFLIRIQLITKD
jgi:actin related protein 2/3 complex, subunit 1A/1B